MVEVAQLSISFPSPLMPPSGTDNWKVLQMLLRAAPGYVYTGDFYDARLGSFRSRISNLRHDFHWNITTGERVSEGVYRYKVIA